MAKEKSEKETSTVTKLRQTANALPDKKTLENAVGQLSEIDSRLATQRGAYMSKCATIRADKKELLDEFRNRGINTKAILAYYESRKLVDKAQTKLEDLDDDTAPIADHIVEQLGLFDDLSRVKAA